MKSFRNRLIRVLKMLPDKKKYYCYIILYIVSSVCCPFASASFISIIVKKFEDGISIFSLIAPLIFIVFINFIHTYFSEKMEKINFLFRLSLISKLVEKSTRLNIRYLESKEGRTSHTEAKRAVLEGNNVGIEIFLNKVVSIFISVLCIVVELLIIFSVSMTASIIFLLTVVAIIYINYKIEKRDVMIQNRLAECYGEIEELHNAIIDGRNQKDIYLYSMSELFMTKFQKKRDKVEKFWEKSEKLYVRGEVLSIVLSLVRELMIGLILFRLLGKGEIELSYFLFIMSSTVYFKGWQDSLLYDFQDIFQNSVIIEKFFSFLDISNQYYDEKKEKTITDIQSVDLQNVCFSYDGEKNVLSDINIHIKKGEKIAFVGVNGAGKTTLAKLLLGIYLPCSGTMLVNRKRIDESNLGVYKQHIASSFQKNIVFPFSVKENIICKNEDKEDIEKFEMSLDTAKIKSTIEEMKYGINSNLTKELDNEGIILSGGQLQRLLLARTIYQDKDFVILDEPTSALDPISESEIFNSYMSILNDKTVIFITHKLLSVKSCNYIYVIDDGKIVESGIHDDLIKCRGVYYNLYTTQSEKYLKHSRKVEKEF